MSAELPSGYERPPQESQAELPLEVKIHGFTEPIPNVNHPIIPLEQNRRESNINAAVVAEIRLPIVDADGAPKVLQLLDFGQDTSADNPKPFFAKPHMAGFFEVKDRFGLRAAKQSDDPYATGFLSLAAGSNTTLGRDRSIMNNVVMGLSDRVNDHDHNDRNGTLSREHFTVTIGQGNQDIQITDHSLNAIRLKAHRY